MKELQDLEASDKNGGGIITGRTSDGTGVAGPKKQYKLCEYSSEHRGMGGAPIETRLKGNLIETNKDQMKPFRALEASYRRMGLPTSCLQGVGNSFTEGPDRFLVAQVCKYNNNLQPCIQLTCVQLKIGSKRMGTSQAHRQ